MAHQEKVGLRIAEFVAALPFGRTTLYGLPEDQRPRSVRVGGVVVILEQPREFLERIERAQAAPKVSP